MISSPAVRAVIQRVSEASVAVDGEVVGTIGRGLVVSYEIVRVDLLDPSSLPPALEGIDYTLPMASAQVKSAVLLAGLYGSGRTSVTEPAPTRSEWPSN